jgi:hypothetical protein
VPQLPAHGLRVDVRGDELVDVQARIGAPRRDLVVAEPVVTVERRPVGVVETAIRLEVGDDEPSARA